MITKHYLVISAIIGGVIVSLLTALLISPVTAQKGFDLNRDKFDTIQCSRLEVVDADGEFRVVLKTDERGRHVSATGNETFMAGLIPNGSMAALGVDVRGGRIIDYGNYRNHSKSKVELCINEHGRKIAVESKGRGVIEINEFGNGLSPHTTRTAIASNPNNRAAQN